MHQITQPRKSPSPWERWDPVPRQNVLGINGLVQISISAFAWAGSQCLRCAYFSVPRGTLGRTLFSIRSGALGILVRCIARSRSVLWGEPLRTPCCTILLGAGPSICGKPCVPAGHILSTWLRPQKASGASLLRMLRDPRGLWDPLCSAYCSTPQATLPSVRPDGRTSWLEVHCLQDKHCPVVTPEMSP